MEGGPPAAQGRNGLSVVTTVWGMTPGTQAPTARHPSVPYETMPVYRGGPAAHPRSQVPTGSYPPQPTGQPAGFYRQNSLPSGAG